MTLKYFSMFSGIGGFELGIEASNIDAECVGYSDVEFGGRGYQMPHFGFGGGVEYGYSAPIARRLNLDFSLGIGYQGGTYHEYVPIDNHYVWQSTRKRNWFGPTKLEVSLVWLIGRGNYHK